MEMIPQAAATALPIVGSMMAAKGINKSGLAQQEAANFEAEQMDQNAGQVEAASQRNAMDRERETEMLQSRALAVAGASGAGAMDPTVLRIIGGIAKEGKLASEMELYNGKSQAQSMRTQGKATRYQGYQTALASRTQGFATMMSGFGQGIGNYFGAGRYYNIPLTPGVR
jgi:hypothetical protein